MPIRLTSAQRRAILADYDAEIPVVEIAAKHGIHNTYPAILARRRGRARRNTRLSKAVDYPRIMRAKQNGVPTEVIGAIFKITDRHARLIISQEARQ